jgi:hypothetical protein
MQAEGAADAGWLRQLMQGGPSSFKSFGELARGLLTSPEWPAKAKPQPRSLAALLSKLDRGVELEWLADRPEVQLALARLLGTSRVHIETVVKGSVRNADDDRHRIRWRDLPYAAPFDSRKEPLPPGLPREVSEPYGWGRTWWLAPSGSGRSLAGAWLRARGLAAFVSAADGAEAQSSLPDGGAVFVELTSAHGEALLPAPRGAICVAAPEPPRDERGWTLVRSPPLADSIDALVEWVALRLPLDGNFERRSAASWVRRAIEDRVVDTLGGAIGLLGAVDRFGVAELERLGVDLAAERFIAEEATKTADEDADSAWLRDRAGAAFAGLVERALVDSNDPWDGPRSFDDWVRLVPPQYRETSGRVSDGAYGVVRSFERAGFLLRHGDRDAFTAGPRWIADRMLFRAQRSLVEGAGAAWGEALLSAGSAPSIGRLLLARVLDGDFEPLEEAVDASTEGSPGAAAAVDFAFRAAGIALLLDVEVPGDAVRALWDAVVARVVERRDGPHPLLRHGTVATKDPLFDVGTFRLAAFAISESLPVGAGAPHALLRPWNVKPDADVLGKVLDSIGGVVARLSESDSTWGYEAFDIAERLVRLMGRPFESRLLEWPAKLLEALETNEKTFRKLCRVDVPDVAVDRLFHLGGDRGFGQAPLASALWLSWAGAPSPVGEKTLFSPSRPGALRLYRHAPPAALEALASGLVDVRTLPFSALDEEQWRSLVAAKPAALRGVAEAWRVAPPSIALAEMRRGALDKDDLVTLWSRFSEELLGAASELTADEALSAVLDSAPLATTESLIARVVGARPDAASRAGAFRDWLHDLIERRGTGWRAAFDALAGSRGASDVPGTKAT